MFQRRILGLVSYYIGATPDKYATKTIHYINIPMEEYFQEVYDYFEHIEEEKEYDEKQIVEALQKNQNYDKIVQKNKELEDHVNWLMEQAKEIGHH